MQRRGILAFKAWGDFHKVNYIRELRMGDMNTYTRGYRLHLQSGKTGRQEPRRRRRRKEEAEHTPRANIFKPGDPSFRWEKQDLMGPCAQGPRPRPRPATWQRQPLSFPPPNRTLPPLSLTSQRRLNRFRNLSLGTWLLVIGTGGKGGWR